MSNPYYFNIHIPPSGKPWSALSDKEKNRLKDYETTFLCGAEWGSDPNDDYFSNYCFDPREKFVVNCDVCILAAFGKGIKIHP